MGLVGLSLDKPDKVSLIDQQQYIIEYKYMNGGGLYEILNVFMYRNMRMIIAAQ